MLRDARLALRWEMVSHVTAQTFVAACEPLLSERKMALCARIRNQPPSKKTSDRKSGFTSQRCANYPMLPVESGKLSAFATFSNVAGYIKLSPRQRATGNMVAANKLIY